MGRVLLTALPPGAPTVLRARGKGGCSAPLGRFAVVSTIRSTTIECSTPGGTLRIATVEHLFAALAGLGIYDGLLIEVEGAELPLLDGGAARWVSAISALGLASSRPGMRITRHEAIAIGSSRYECAPGDSPAVEIVLELDDPRLATAAVWYADAQDFGDRIAPARTFALEAHVGELLASGLARHVDPTSVVLVAADAIHFAGAPFQADEPARHKLLDLMGDLYLCGGPPLGTLRAVRPGHTANAEMCRIALENGLFSAL